MKSISNLFMGDRVIWVVYFFLCIISLVEVFSAASTLAYKSGSFWDPLIKQALFLSVGTLVVIAVHRVPCRVFKAVPIFMIPISLILLSVTFFMGAITNGAKRWLEIGGVPFQPSELAKGSLIIAVALVLSRMQTEDGADRKAFKYILILSALICLPIFPENLSTACLLFGVVVLMMFIGRVPLLQLGKMLGVLFTVGALGVMFLLSLPKSENTTDDGLLHRFSTWNNRITKHFASDEDDKAAKLDPALFDIDKDAQIAHANIAIASSNGIGKLPGNSVERDFLSQAFSDFIFAIIIEEMGIWGACIVVFLYIILLFRAGRIASRCERNFPPFLAMGLTLLLVSQAILNMMVATGLFPVTGQPLPLISRGGTSTLINSVYIGMILSVSRYARQVSEPQHTNFDGPMDEIKRTRDKGSLDADVQPA